jgi:hypothetical protein
MKKKEKKEKTPNSMRVKNTRNTPLHCIGTTKSFEI